MASKDAAATAEQQQEQTADEARKKALSANRLPAGFLAARATVGKDNETVFGQAQAFQQEQGLLTCLAKSPQGQGQWRGFRLFLLPNGDLEAERYG